MNLNVNGFILDETDHLAAKIIGCRKCDRVIKHCQAVANKEIMRRTPFATETYWGRPVPNFGLLPARFLIVGLAPGAHGSNRTSRMFTGDDSGLWLYRALHKAGFATTAGCTTVGDNRLIGTSITSVTHCAPPGNKPTPEEIRACAPYLVETIRRANPRVILALGSIAWSNTLKALETLYKEHSNDVSPRSAAASKFSHGGQVKVKLNSETIDVLASYHVSRQNTNTGRLTEPMLDSVFAKARKIIGAGKSK